MDPKENTPDKSEGTQALFSIAIHPLDQSLPNTIREADAVSRAGHHLPPPAPEDHTVSQGKTGYSRQ